MARALGERTAPEPSGPSGCVVLTASVVLDDGGAAGDTGLYPMQAQLVSLLETPNCKQRLCAIGAQIARGTSRVSEHAPRDWHLPIKDAVDFFDGPQASLVMAVPGSRRRELDKLSPSFDSRTLAPIIFVTDDPEAFHDLRLARPYGVVETRTDDLLGTAGTVFRMMVSLQAPNTFACTDVEDVEAVFARGSHARLCEAAWSPEGGLLFACAADQALLEGADGVLVHLNLEEFGSLRLVSDVFRNVRQITPLNVTAIQIAPVGMFVETGTRAGFRSVPLLCTVGRPRLLPRGFGFAPGAVHRLHSV